MAATTQLGGRGGRVWTELSACTAPPHTPQRPHGAGPAPSRSLPQERLSLRRDPPEAGLLGRPSPPFLRPGLGDTWNLCVSAAQGPGPDSPPAARPSGPPPGGGSFLPGSWAAARPPPPALLVWSPPHCCECAPPGDEAGVPAAFSALPGHGPLPLAPPHRRIRVRWVEGRASRAEAVLGWGAALGHSLRLPVAAWGSRDQNLPPDSRVRYTAPP